MSITLLSISEDDLSTLRNVPLYLDYSTAAVANTACQSINSLTFACLLTAIVIAATNCSLRVLKSAKR